MRTHPNQPSSSPLHFQNFKSVSIGIALFLITSLGSALLGIGLAQKFSYSVPKKFSIIIGGSGLGLGILGTVAFFLRLHHLQKMPFQSSGQFQPGSESVRKEMESTDDADLKAFRKKTVVADKADPEELEERIATAIEAASDSIDLTNLNLNLFPASLLLKKNFKSFNLSHNKIKETPFTFPTGAEHVNLSYNELESYDSQNLVLTNITLETLDLSHNKLASLPKATTIFLPKLQCLNLSHNNISNLDSFTLQSFGTGIDSPSQTLQIILSHNPLTEEPEDLEYNREKIKLVF